MIEEIDFNVGRILDAIHEMGLAENTYVLFTSDNGPWLIKNKDHADGHLAKRPRRFGRAACAAARFRRSRAGVRVPTILWGPGRVPAGTTCDAIASTLDILPTFAALAGAEAPDGPRHRRRRHPPSVPRRLRQSRSATRLTSITCAFTFRPSVKAVEAASCRVTKEPVGAAPFARNTHIAPADRVGFEEPFLVDSGERHRRNDQRRRTTPGSRSAPAGAGRSDARRPGRLRSGRQEHAILRSDTSASDCSARAQTVTNQALAGRFQTVLPFSNAGSLLGVRH